MTEFEILKYRPESPGLTVWRVVRLDRSEITQQEVSSLTAVDVQEGADEISLA